jgi:cytochrome oxidase assembly protein ShyY1
MRVKQALVLAAGIIIAIAMMGLGLWQMQVFTDQGTSSAQHRAELDPIPLLSEIAADNSVGDVYGRPVTASGTYLPDQQVLVRDSDGTARVLAALRVDDGRVLPVVLGVLPTGASAPVLSGRGDVTGVFLASDKTPDPVPSLGPGEIAGVRLAKLAQLWPQQTLPGYVTLTPEASEQLGLSPAALALPSEEGSARNQGYALQWWVFAAFAIAIAVKVSRDIGRKPAGAASTMGSGTAH